MHLDQLINDERAPVSRTRFVFLGTRTNSSCEDQLYSLNRHNNPRQHKPSGSAANSKLRRKSRIFARFIGQSCIMIHAQ